MHFKHSVGYFYFFFWVHFLKKPFDNRIVPNGISPMGNSGCFPRGKPAATESRYPTFCCMLGVLVFPYSTELLTWTTGFLTCAQMLMHAVAHEGVRTHVRESALQEESGRKIPRRTGESNLPQRRDGPTLYQLSCNTASRDDKSWQQVKYVKLYILTCWRQSPKSCDT